MAVWDQGGIDKRRALAVLLVLVGWSVAYFWLAWHWSYSSGERAGWVRTFSSKGSICKTWEGEMAMVSMPGSATEKFAFTVWNDEVAELINTLLGRLVTLHYEQKVGLPSSCFGDSRYYVTRVRSIEKIRFALGVVMPVVVGSERLQ